MNAGLLERAREHVVSNVDGLEGEGDFMPFMLINGPKAHVYVALDMPRFGSPRDDIADVMMAMIAIHRATEAVFASMAWTLRAMTDEERKAWGNRDFGEHPDREETVFMIYAGATGDQFHSAPVIRERTTNVVRLGPWDSHDQEDGYKMSGRFANAMHAGMDMSRNMPVDLIQFIEAEMAAGHERELMAPMIRAYRRVRTGDFTTEELEEAKRLAEQLQRGDP